MKRFHILGSGIGGLSIAHEITNKYPEAFVTIYEKNSIAGGQARASRDINNNHVEYCWHAFGTAYKNMFGYLKEVGVYQNLVPVNKYIYDSKNNKIVTEYGRHFLTSDSIFTVIQMFENLGITINFTDMYFLLKIYWQTKGYKYLGIIPEQEEDNVAWYNLINCNITDEKLKQWLIGFPSIYLGMEATRVSVKTVLDVSRSGLKNTSSKTYEHDFMIPNGPMNEKIIEPWVNFLKSRGVIFRFDCKVHALLNSNHRISKLILERETLDLVPGLDIVINSLDVPNWTNLINKINIESDEYLYYTTKWNQLTFKSHQIQSQIVFTLNETLTWDKNGTLVILMESPWSIMLRIESNIWDPQEGEIISCGIGRWDVKSETTNLPACQMSPDELAIECWHQLLKYAKTLTSTTEMVKGTTSEKTIQDIGYQKYTFWPYKYDTSNKRIITDEPKFSNNIGCYALRPLPKDTYFTNVYHVNAYTRQEKYDYKNTDLFCMENASSIAKKVIEML